MKELFLYIILPIITSIAASFIYDGIKGLTVFSSLSTVSYWLWNKLIWLLNVEIKLWLMSAIALCALIAKKIIKAIQISRTANQPDWLSYTSGVLRVWHWKWIYHRNYNGKYSIENLTPFCPDCGCELQVYHTLSGDRYRCPNHSQDSPIQEKFQKIENREEIEKLIGHRIGSGSYPKA